MPIPHYVQGIAPPSYTYATSTSQTYPNDVTKGNLLICVAQYFYPGTGDPAYTVTDTQGNTWVALTNSGIAASESCQIFYCLSANASGPNTVTMTWDGTHGYYIQQAILEYGDSFGTFGFSLDKSANNTSGVGTTVIDALTGLVGAGELIIEAMAGSSTTSIALTDGATNRLVDNTNFVIGENFSTGTSYTASMSWGGAYYGAVAAAAFIATGGALPGIPGALCMMGCGAS